MYMYIYMEEEADDAEEKARLPFLQHHRFNPRSGQPDIYIYIYIHIYIYITYIIYLYKFGLTRGANVSAVAEGYIFT